MSGTGAGVDEELPPTSEIIKEAMKEYDVTEKIAEKIISDRNVFALEKMKKWIGNWKKIQKGKAEYIYTLTRSLKRGRGNNKITIDEIEQKILEMCVE